MPCYSASISLWDTADAECGMKQMFVRTGDQFGSGLSGNCVFGFADV